MPSSPKNQYLGDRAVVIGGSIAGLLAARVLADYFHEVVIVERDQFPDTPLARRGVPQSVQPHNLLTRGYRVLQDLFPDVEQELLAVGSVPIDWAREFRHFVRGGWGMPATDPSPYKSFTCSRPLLEWVIRQQLMQISHIKFQAKSRVVGLQYEPSEQQVSGVKIGQHSPSTATTTISAKLVVNAGGRSSQAADWLEGIGFTAPLTTVINPKLGYATRRYRVSNPANISWKVMLINHEAPVQGRLGYLARIEGDEWIATLGGYGQDYPPLENAGFKAFAQTLSSPEFYEFIQNAEPTSEIFAYRATANRLHHYETIGLPKGFVTLGDALCALCPVYGQGMTVSAISALTLRDWLQKALHKKNRQLNSSEFQRHLAQVIVDPWTLATSQDSQFETTQGAIHPHGIEQLLTRYFDKLIRKTHQDSKLHSLLIEVTHMLKRPTAFFHPFTVFQVFRN